MKFKIGVTYSNGLRGDANRIVHTVVRREDNFVVLENRRKIPIHKMGELEYIIPVKVRRRKNPPKIFAHNIEV